MASSNRDTKYAGTESVQGGLYDVLLALKENVFNYLNVATLATVQSIDESNQSAYVTPFPLTEDESSKNIQCYGVLLPCVTKDDNNDMSIGWTSLISNISKGDVVMVVFLNRNSEQNLKQSRNKQTLTELSNNTDQHSDKYGIIIGLCYKKS